MEKLRSTDGVTSYISAAAPEMIVLSHPTTDPTQTIKEQQITQQFHHWHHLRSLRDGTLLGAHIHWPLCTIDFA